ncbi:MAG: tRNA (N(6)-L-threonylcarbamoyladenosine(37)-C(2))-methylthiotransferase MtaB [Clostridiales bacterium]|nr:tRNA (N(6)-L-threonylcarbamoyladenosine(37)-C(2))-methylthiotransferase MtaB [Clostridiales bacterium]
MKRAALHSLGCKVNAYETEAMRQMLEQSGYEIVPFHEEADLYVINTCSVTNMADRKSRQMVHRARKLNPDAIVVAAGCYVQTNPDQAAEDMAVDIVIGNNRKQDLIALIENFEHNRSVSTPENEKQTRAVLDINLPGQDYEELKVDHPADHTRAFLKVQDGCNQFCTYCVIPYARGRARSRRPEDVVRETEELARNGFREIVLTGIHLSSYGLDIGCKLLDLICAVHAVEGIRRIRLGSLEPGIITEEFVRALAGMEKVCPHFHLSLQSGSDTVLRRMNRRYTTEEYYHKCELLRQYYEHPALTTDIIVGFPGETEEEFAGTCAFVQKVDFYEIHVFKYSRRRGTAADRMEGHLPESVKTERSHRLMEITKEQKEQFCTWYEGRTVEALFEESVRVNGETWWEGFTPEYVKTWFRTEESVQNRIMKVEFFRLLV